MFTNMFRAYDFDINYEYCYFVQHFVLEMRKAELLFPRDIFSVVFYEDFEEFALYDYKEREEVVYKSIFPELFCSLDIDNKMKLISFAFVLFI